ncbi:MAG: endolytic transglycosylase MltG [Burkholderiales bacterium]|nr:endolytic transglycosylase MltG [Burkholderiales bacterium]
MATLKKIISFCILLLVLAAALSTWGMLRWIDTPLLSDAPEQASKNLEFTIKAGSNVRSAARQIADAGVPLHPILFEVLARATGKANKLKAGSFEVQGQDTPLQILAKIVDGKFSMASLSVIEGWSFKQMRSAIDAHPAIQHDTLALSNQELMRKIGSPFAHPEGLFFPDTYRFAKNSSDLQIYQQAYQAMQAHLEQAWNQRDQDMPYKDAYQALTMASIVEKETGQASDRTMVASVFVNRLRIGMMLQTDPTVIYGMGERFQGNIRKSDLTTDTPYNTYTRAGLPPTPISLPGLASLKAALHPEPSRALYFVARGDGSSVFSDNLDAHNRAVNQYQR